ncbi:hypothetical protein DFH07DRAFT_745128, partial [Mycena maculata]
RFTEFQILYAQVAFHAERIAWRTVVYLNLVQSVRRILDALQPETDIVDENGGGDSLETASAISGKTVANYEGYRRRLQPLMQLEDHLIRLLRSPEEDEPIHFCPWKGQDPNGPPTPTILIPPSTPSLSHGTASSKSSPMSVHGHKSNEVTVHAATNWKEAFWLGKRSKRRNGAHSGEIEGWWEDPDDPVHTMYDCATCMREMWADENVRQRLRRKGIRLEESSGLCVFLLCFSFYLF